MDKKIHLTMAKKKTSDNRQQIVELSKESDKRKEPKENYKESLTDQSTA